MQPLTHTLHGTVYRRENQFALLLDEAARPVYLRYALVVRGLEEHVFPALVVDDWGRENATAALYRWIYDEGPRFPRSEVFGFEATGEETQLFLRELETFFKLPCYAYPSEGAAVTDGVQVARIFLPGLRAGHEPERIDAPPDFPWPLQHAQVSWWRVNVAELARFGFAIYAL